MSAFFKPSARFRRMNPNNGRVVIDSDAHPALVPSQVVDPTGDHLAEVLVREVIDAGPFGPPLRLPFPARILEIPDQLLLLRVHRHHGLTPLLEGDHLTVDVPELGIPIGVGATPPSLAKGLEAVAQFVQEDGHGLVAHPMPLSGQRLGEVPGALAGPPQGGLRVPTGRRFDQGVQVSHQGRVVHLQRVPTAAGPPHPSWEFPDAGFILDPQIVPLSEFPHPLTDRGPGQPGGFRHNGHSPSLQGQGLRSGPLPSHPLVHQGTQLVVLGSHGIEGQFSHSARVAIEDWIVQLIF
jgi:hypothetical protein